MGLRLILKICKEFPTKSLKFFLIEIYKDIGCIFVNTGYRLHQYQLSISAMPVINFFSLLSFLLSLFYLLSLYYTQFRLHVCILEGINETAWEMCAHQQSKIWRWNGLKLALSLVWFKVMEKKDYKKRKDLSVKLAEYAWSSRPPIIGGQCTAVIFLCALNGSFKYVITKWD